MEIATVLLFGLITAVLFEIFSIIMIKGAGATSRSILSVKNLAILGILFFVTSIITGATITGMLTDSNSDYIENLASKIDSNNQIIKNLEKYIASIKSEEISNKNLDYLKEQIKLLREENLQLKEEIEDLEDDIDDVYAIFPLSLY